MKQKAFIKALWKTADDFGISLTVNASRQLFIYFSELFIWNERMNLISKKEKGRFIERHIIDSLSIVTAIHANACDRFLDIGSGNGLPAIPLAVKFPECRFDLIESNRKKCVFLQHIKAKMKLDKVFIFCERFEQVYENLEKYTYVLVRGKRISRREEEMIMHCLKKQGNLIIYAGKKVPFSREISGENIELLNGVKGRKIIKISKE